MDYTGNSLFTTSDFMQKVDNGIQNSLGTGSEADDSDTYKQLRKKRWPTQRELLVDSFQMKQVNQNMV